MNKLFFFLAAVLIVAESFGACRDAPANPAAEKANPAGEAPMVEMPLKGNEPMPTGMKE